MTRPQFGSIRSTRQILRAWARARRRADTSNAVGSSGFDPATTIATLAIVLGLIAIILNH